MNKELKEILEAFKWTFDNMGAPHTPDHFNIPANGIKMLENLIDTNNKNDTVYAFQLECRSQGHVSRWDIYTKNNPFNYLKWTKENDIKQGWDGSSYMPIRNWQVKDIEELSWIEWLEIKLDEHNNGNPIELDDIDEL